MAAPFQFRLSRKSDWTSRLTLQPGLAFTAINFRPRLTDFGSPDRTDEYLAMLMHTSGALGRELSPLVSVGGGVDLPITFFVGGGTASRMVESFSVVPILFGPDLQELQLGFGPPLTGEDLTTASGDIRVDFGLRFQLGLRFGL